MNLQCFGGLIISASFALFSSCGNSDNQAENITNTDSTEAITDNSVTMPSAVEFPSKDGLLISGVLWEIDPNATTILLCHQAGSNFHEYDEIAPQLNEMGYNCLAIDQRAGGILFDLVNQTADRAITIGAPISYIDAEQDIHAAIDYCYTMYHKPVILWGSSYSAGLALHLAEESAYVSAVIAFSPGNYFEDKKVPLAETMQTFTKPFFITSSKHEASTITTFLAKAQADKLHVQFIPELDGQHGSKTLWAETPNNGEYWKAIRKFLEDLDLSTSKNP